LPYIIEGEHEVESAVLNDCEALHDLDATASVGISAADISDVAITAVTEASTTAAADDLATAAVSVGFTGADTSYGSSGASSDSDNESVDNGNDMEVAVNDEHQETIIDSNSSARHNSSSHTAATTPATTVAPCSNDMASAKASSATRGTDTDDAATQNTVANSAEEMVIDSGAAKPVMTVLQQQQHQQQLQQHQQQVQQQQQHVAMPRHVTPIICFTGLSGSGNSSSSNSSSSSSSNSSSRSTGGNGSKIVPAQPLLGPFGSAVSRDAVAVVAAMKQDTAASTGDYEQRSINSSLRGADRRASTGSSDVAAASADADDNGSNSTTDSNSANVKAATENDVAIDVSNHRASGSTAAAAVAVDDDIAAEHAEPAAAVHIDALSTLHTLIAFRGSLVQALQGPNSDELKLQQVQWVLDLAVEQAPLLVLPVQDAAAVYAQLPAAAAADLQRLMQLHSFEQQTLGSIATVPSAKLQMVRFVVLCKLNADQ
jgi:hypothetical protein